MQRRAAAIFVAFFLVVAVGAYALIGAADEPTVQIDEADRDHVVTGDGSLQIGGVEYDVTDLDGAAGSAEASWLNESARFTATLADNSTVPYRDANYTVVVQNASEPDRFRLHEVQPIDRPTTVQDGTRYVVFEEGTNRTLVPVSEYLPDPMIYPFVIGDEFPYEGNATTVAAVSTEEVTLEWFGPQTETVSFAEGQNTTIDGTPYLVTFPDEETMVLTTAYDEYDASLARIDFYHERMSGLWGVIILSGIVAFILVGMAYIPSRY